MRIVFEAYNPASEGVQALKQELLDRGIKSLVLRKNSSRYKYNARTDRVINWGCSEVREDFKGVPIINLAPFVAQAIDKVSFFDHIAEKPYCPPYTIAHEEAVEWLEAGDTVVARTVVNGHGGAGIHVLTALDQFVRAPLYTKYIKKKDEYRVHAYAGEVIDIQRKAIRPGVENPNFKVRNAANGFIFVRNEVNPPDVVREAALDAVKTLGLHFGAADVIYNAKNNAAYVLEINTAPGLVGQTVQSYANAILKAL